MNLFQGYNIYRIAINSFLEGLSDPLKEKKTLFLQESSSNVEKSNILMNMCMSDMVQCRIFYIILDYGKQKWNHVNKKRLFSKIKQKMQKKRNGETFKSVSKHPKKNLKVVEQKLRSVFSSESRMDW